MTVTVTATAEDPGDGPPRIRLDVTSSGAGHLEAVTLLRVHHLAGPGRPAGWSTPLRIAASGAADGLLPLAAQADGSHAGTAYDYEAPYGAPVWYYAAEVHPAEGITPHITLSPARPWLIRPGDPARSVPLAIVELAERVREVDEGRFRVLGRRDLVVITDGARRAPDSVLRLRTATLEEAAALDDLADDAAPLLLNIDRGRGYGVSYEYVAVGRLLERRLTPGDGRHPGRVWDLPYSVVADVIGGTAGGAIGPNPTLARDYDDLLDEAADYAALEARFSSYAALEAGTPNA